mmetsp:Transcript_19088/g.24063  ORF Transcript_19088/g.24063 Transcript_19088/m.24063 type:complete len:425 (-) Transcript_19088:99-1373(-)
MMLNAELDVLRAEKLESQKESEKMIEELKEHVLTLEKKAESSQEGRMNRMSLPDINPSWSISSIEPSNGSTASVESKRLDQPSKTPKQEEEMEIDNTWMEEEIDSKSEDEDSEYEPDVNIKKPKSSKRRKVPKPLLPKGQTSQEANVLDEIDNLLDDGAPTKLLSLPEPLEDCKVAQLKAVLKSHGMAVSGKKDILIQRLRNQNYQILWLSGSIPELPLGVEAMEDMLQRRDEFLRLKEEGKLSEVCPIESSMLQEEEILVSPDKSGNINDEQSEGNVSASELRELSNSGLGDSHESDSSITLQSSPTMEEIEDAHLTLSNVSGEVQEEEPLLPLTNAVKRRQSAVINDKENINTNIVVEDTKTEGEKKQLLAKNQKTGLFLASMNDSTSELRGTDIKPENKNKKKQKRKPLGKRISNVHVKIL